MQEIMCMLMNASEYLGSPIAGPPYNLDKYVHSGPKIGFSWSNGDRDAEIDYSYDGGTTIKGVLAPQEASWNTVYTDATWDASGNTFAVRHRDGIYTSAWVEYSDV